MLHTLSPFLHTSRKCKTRQHKDFFIYKSCDDDRYMRLNIYMHMCTIKMKSYGVKINREENAKKEKNESVLKTKKL